MILLFYWLLYSAITETRPCDLGLIALLLLGLMYGKLNHYVIRKESVHTTTPGADLGGGGGGGGGSKGAVAPLFLSKLLLGQ